jgi:hypothetical protein
MEFFSGDDGTIYLSTLGRGWREGIWGEGRDQGVRGKAGGKAEGSWLAELGPRVSEQ